MIQGIKLSTSIDLEILFLSEANWILGWEEATYSIWRSLHNKTEFSALITIQLSSSSKNREHLWKHSRTHLFLVILLLCCWNFCNEANHWLECSNFKVYINKNIFLELCCSVIIRSYFELVLNYKLLVVSYSTPPSTIPLDLTKTL